MLSPHVGMQAKYLSQLWAVYKSSIMFIGNPTQADLSRKGNLFAQTTGNPCCWCSSSLASAIPSLSLFLSLHLSALLSSMLNAFLGRFSPYYGKDSARTALGLHAAILAAQKRTPLSQQLCTSWRASSYWFILSCFTRPSSQGNRMFWLSRPGSHAYPCKWKMRSAVLTHVDQM